MLRLWRDVEDKPRHLDAEVRKARITTVSIPLPPAGQAKPGLLRLNALPILALPKHCQSLKLRQSVDWSGVRALERGSRGSLILTRADNVLCWGTQESVRAVFGEGLVSISEAELPENFALPGNQYVEGFLESALALALARNRPVRARKPHLLVAAYCYHCSVGEPGHTFLGPRVAGTQGSRRREGAARRSLRSKDGRASSGCHRGRSSGRRGRPDYAGRPFDRSCSPTDRRASSKGAAARRLRK